MLKMRVVSFVAGAFVGAYVAQNYEIPSMEKVASDAMDKLKSLFPPKNED